MVRLMIEDSTYTIIHVVPKKDLFEIFHTNSEANASEFVWKSQINVSSLKGVVCGLRINSCKDTIAIRDIQWY